MLFLSHCTPAICGSVPSYNIKLPYSIQYYTDNIILCLIFTKNIDAVPPLDYG